jgi:predicted MFS family arabinose efflux permease
LGPALGPGLGGILIELVTWRGLFWINVPVGIAALIGSRFLVPSGDAAPSLSPDMKGIFLVGIGLPLFLFGSAEIGVSGPDVATLICTMLGAVLIWGALWHLRRADAPLIDLRLFARPGFAAAVATASLTGAAMYAGLLLFPLYLQRSLELGETETGGLLLVMGLGSAIALPIAGKLTDRHGPAVVSVRGPLFCCSVQRRSLQRQT